MRDGEIRYAAAQFFHDRHHFFLFLIPSSGEIRIDGVPTRKALSRIAYVEQKSHIDFTFPITIRECVALGRTVKKAPLQRLTKEDWAKVDEAIEEVGLSELATRQIGALSGGQFQRVLQIGRAHV